ncbi:MAG TPA: 1-acyl-sn-glycerol-3-phosphate acyltransferase [Thermoanaerobaculia bacterium]
MNAAPDADSSSGIRGEAAEWAVVGGGVGGRPTAPGRLAEALAEALGGELVADGEGLAAALSAGGRRHVVYAPTRRAGGPPEEAAAAVLAALAAAPVERVVVLSSAEVYGPHHHNDLYFAEDAYPARPHANRLAVRWRRFEAAAESAFAGRRERLVVLRPAPVPLAGGEDFWSRFLLGRGPAATLPGHDPTIQLLALDDLVAAVRRAAAAPGGGPYNVVPAGAVPVRRALRLAGRRRLALPRLAQEAARRLARTAEPAERLGYLRYGWTADGGRAAAELGFTAGATSAQAAAAAAGRPLPEPPPGFDAFGYDPEYVAAFGRTLFRFLHDAWWRIEVRGLENVPRRGRAVLAGVHRGFMPWDGVMSLHHLVREVGRPPRFMLHPTLLKFPFLFNYMTKLGGVPACQANADRILGADGLLAIFPEGIRGAFTPYRRAYKLGKFGRDEYVRMALRNRAPIVPFVTVGSAEIYPILARLDWGWLKRYLEWPYLPITPTFPWLPVPLPSKWHTRWLEPLHVEEMHGPEAADDPEVVKRLSREVRRRMTEAIGEMLVRRRSIWYGTVFDDEPAERRERKPAEAAEAAAVGTPGPR